MAWEPQQRGPGLIVVVLAFMSSCSALLGSSVTLGAQIELGCDYIPACKGFVELDSTSKCNSSFGPSGEVNGAVLGKKGRACLQCPDGAGVINLSAFPYFICNGSTLCGHVTDLDLFLTPNQGKCIFEAPNRLLKCLRSCTPIRVEIESEVSTSSSPPTAGGENEPRSSASAGTAGGESNNSPTSTGYLINITELANGTASSNSTAHATSLEAILFSRKLLPFSIGAIILLFLLLLCCARLLWTGYRKKSEHPSYANFNVVPKKSPNPVNRSGVESVEKSPGP